MGRAKKPFGFVLRIHDADLHDAEVVSVSEPGKGELEIRLCQPGYQECTLLFRGVARASFNKRLQGLLWLSEEVFASPYAAFKVQVTLAGGDRGTAHATIHADELEIALRSSRPQRR